MMLLKCGTQYVNKFGKFSSGHRTGKGKFSFQSQRRAMPRMFKLPDNCAQASKVMLKILQPRLQQDVNLELPDAQTELRKGRIRHPNCQHSLDHTESKEILEKHLFLLY